MLKLVWSPDSSVVYSEGFISHSVENKRAEALSCYDETDVGKYLHKAEYKNKIISDNRSESIR